MSGRHSSAVSDAEKAIAMRKNGRSQASECLSAAKLEWAKRNAKRLREAQETKAKAAEAAAAAASSATRSMDDVATA